MALTPTTIGNNSSAPGGVANIFVPDQLIAGPFQPVTHNITVLSGQGVLKRGTLIGRVTASGKYIKSLAGASDGSQTVLAVLADDVDATSADALGGAYLSGEFNANAMTYDVSWTLSALQLAGRAYDIYVKQMSAAMSAADPT
jgi:hypothetical protein